MCIKVSQKDLGFFGFNPAQGITNFFHKLMVQCTLVWAAYLHQRQGAKRNYFRVGKCRWLNARVEEFQPIVQLSSVRTMTLRLRGCQQHPGNIIWLPRPFRALSLE